MREEIKGHNFAQLKTLISAEQREIPGQGGGIAAHIGDASGRLLPDGLAYPSIQPLAGRIEKQHIGEGQELLQPPFDSSGVEVCVLQTIEQRIALSTLNAVSALLKSNQANTLLS